MAIELVSSSNCSRSSVDRGCHGAFLGKRDPQPFYVINKETTSVQ